MLNHKQLVIYHFFQKDQSYIDNLIHFFAFGYSEDIDYIIVLAGNITITLPQFRNVRYLNTENSNHDYGGYCKAISTIAKIEIYDYIFFINSSTRGPFLVTTKKLNWTKPFIDLFEESVGIVGSSINILHGNTTFASLYNQKFTNPLNYAHVQTTAYALSRESLDILLKNGFYDQQPGLSKYDVVTQYELRLSQLLIAEGLNIRCLLPEYNRLDYRITIEDINATSHYGDVCYRNSYFGRTVHPYEIMFIKTNREMYNDKYLDRLSYSMLQNHTIDTEIIKILKFSTYLERIKSAAQTDDLVSPQDQKLNPNQILDYVRGLIYSQPEYSTLLKHVIDSTTAIKIDKSVNIN